MNLALQGGGSHGAFTWGVLDRLLEDERIGFDGVTATSAGGVNAVVLADGLALNGREGARERLRSFWKKMSEVASSSFIAPSFLDQVNPNFGLDQTPNYVFIDTLSRILSPYQLNPFDINPLRDLLNAEVEFRAGAEAKSDQAVPVGDQCAHRQGESVRARGARCRARARLRLPALHDARAGDRRRRLLGRRLHGQSGHLSGDLRLHVAATSSWCI